MPTIKTSAVETNFIVMSLSKAELSHAARMRHRAGYHQLSHTRVQGFQTLDPSPLYLTRLLLQLLRETGTCYAGHKSQRSDETHKSRHYVAHPVNAYIVQILHASANTTMELAHITKCVAST